MKLQVATVLSTVLAVASAHRAHIQGQHAKIARQGPDALAASGTSSVSVAPSGTATGSASVSATLSATSAPSIDTSGLPPQPTGDISVPPLNQISAGMPAGPTPSVTTTYAPGATPSYSGALPLPTSFVFVKSEWPEPDKHAPTDTPQVQEWLKEIEGVDIPDIPVTVNGSCVDTPANAAKSADYGWWTCTGTVRSSDIVSCPDKYTWGLTFDDGPAPYTPKVLQYLDEKNIKSTFFVVGSRAVERPQTLIEQYMAGHEIGIHTWSHPEMTSLTNEQIVAELGWGREAIRRVLGVTPVIWRPPYGDVDDRVRAIATAMGLTTSIWTATPGGQKFDTNDWRVEAGQLTAPEQYSGFQSILGNATLLDTGFIVLEHDLFESTVDLAVGYTINAALAHQPSFTLKPVGECNKIQTRDLYMETTTNQTYIAERKKATAGQSTNTTSGGSQGPSGSGDSASASGASVVSALSSLPILSAFSAAIFALLI